jgi:hypothetical protein
MSGSLIPNAKQQFLDANGNPLAGGKVYYYIPSTTTFKNTYQNAALTILNTNPIVLDSAGECIAYGVGSFRQIVTDVNGNIIWDQPTLGLFSNDATSVIYTPPFTNAVAETASAKFTEIVSVKDFGAVGNGTTNDTTAIQNAINYAQNSRAAVYFPTGTYYLASPLLVSGGIKLFGNSGYYDYGLQSSVLKPATVAIQSTSPDTQTNQGLYIDGLSFSGGSNPIDMGKFHILQIENCAFVGWSGSAICLYQGEKLCFRNLFFYPTVGVAKNCFSFCNKADSTLTLTGTDTTMFIDRVLMENLFLSPVPGEPSNGVEKFIKCSGIFGHVSVINAVAHSTQKESYDLYTVTWCNFVNVVIDGGGLSGAPQNSSFSIAGGIEASVFSNLSVSGGTFYRTYGVKVQGGIYQTVFLGCEFGSGDNTSTFGFAWVTSANGNATFISCNGAFYSNIAVSNSLRANSYANVVNCLFSPNNLGNTTSANTLNQDVIAFILSYDANGSAASTAKFIPAKFSSGGGNSSEPLYLRVDSTWINGNMSFLNSYGESYPQTIRNGSVTPNGNVTANPGSMYMYYSGVSSGNLYIKETGTGNTGWVLK